MSDYIYELYPIALDCEMSADIFWNSGIVDIQDYIESYERRQLKRLKQELQIKHFLAKDVTQLMCRSKNDEALELWDYFPSLFADEKKAAEEERRKHQMVEYKAKMQDYVYRHNEKLKRRGGEG